MNRAILAASSVALGFFLTQNTAQAARIVATDAVAQAVESGAIVWDVREAGVYAKDHIPGAINVGVRVCSRLRTPMNWDYVPIESITSRLGEWGVDPDQRIVVYGEKGSACPYFIQISLELIGASAAQVYHGGIDDWRAAGLPLATEASTLPPRALDLEVRPGVLATTDDIAAAIGRPDVQILDVRTPDEFAGRDIRALRGGHVPGAINIPYELNWVDPAALIKSMADPAAARDGFSLKSTEALRKVYEALDPDKEVVIYCQSSPRASVSATVLKDLGFRDVRVYDSSWVGYGNRFDLPVENETFFDIYALTRSLAAMQTRIETLERRLSDMTAESR